MKGFKILLIVVIALLLFGIVFLIFSIHSRLTTSEYQFQVDAVLSAAMVQNQGEPLTEPDKAVIAEYEGRRFVVVPGNYKSLSFYLRKDAAMPPFLRIDREKAVKITVCNDAIFYAVPADDTGDLVLIRLETGGKVFQMRTDGGNQWTNILNICTDGTYHDQNIPLD